MKQISLKLAFMALCWLMGMGAVAQTVVTIIKIGDGGTGKVVII